MKFTTNLKLFFAIFYIYLTIFTEINAFQNGLTLKNHRTKYLMRYSNRSRFPLKNPMANFLTGLVEDLAQGDQGFFACFPASWKSGTDKTAASTVSGNLSGWAENVSVFLNMATPLISFFCANRENIIGFITTNVANKKTRKYRLLLQSGNRRAGRLLNRRYGVSGIKSAIKGAGNAISGAASSAGNAIKGAASSAGKAISGAASSAGNAIKGAANSIGNFVYDKIVSPVFNNWFEPSKIKVIALINKIKDFFASGIIDQVKNCISGVKAALPKIKEVFEGLKAKFNILKLAVSLGPQAIIIFAVDFIVALICEYQMLKDGITNLSAGQKAKDNNEKYYRYGKALGIMLKSFGLSKTFSESILKKMRG